MERVVSDLRIFEEVGAAADDAGLLRGEFIKKAHSGRLTVTGCISAQRPGAAHRKLCGPVQGGG